MKAEKTICNMCGKRIPVFAGKQTEDYLKVKKEWGYFSEKDGISHCFCICENCYNQWIGTFRIPVSENETSVIL